MEGEVTSAEVHGRGDAELEVGAQAELAQYTHGKAWVPSVLIHRHVACQLLSVLVGEGHLSCVQQFEVLQMCAHHHTEVEGAQVTVRAILYRSLLRHRGESREAAGNGKQPSMGIFCQNLHDVMELGGSMGFPIINNVLL